MNVSYELALDREKKKKGKKKSATFGAKSGQKKKERRSEKKKKKKRQRGTNLFPSLPTEKTDREREKERGGGRVRDGFFARVDAARDVGQRHVAGVMRRDTLVDGRRRRSSSSSSSLSSSVEEERVGPPPPDQSLDKWVFTYIEL